MEVENIIIDIFLILSFHTHFIVWILKSVFFYVFDIFCVSKTKWLDNALDVITEMMLYPRKKKTEERVYA